MGQPQRRRIQILAGIFALALSPCASAQRSAKLTRIGMLMPVSATDAAPNLDAFRRGLRELGHVEGQGFAIEARYSEGKDELLRGLADELVKRKVDIVVTWGTPAARAARRATKTIPIVTAAVVDPVGTGLVASLSRPGANLTGVTSGGAELSRKSLQLLKELAPRAQHVAILWNPASPPQLVMFRETQVAADALKLRLQSVRASDPSEFENAFGSIHNARPDALLVLQDPMLQAHRSEIIDFVSKIRLPTMYERSPWVEAGGLMSYGVSFPDNFRRAAVFVDKILKGANPADLPVEDPTKFELAVNLRSAKSLGLAVPQSILMRADKIIQ